MLEEKNYVKWQLSAKPFNHHIREFNTSSLAKYKWESAPVGSGLC